MTTIGSTSYYTPGAFRGGDRSSNAAADVPAGSQVGLDSRPSTGPVSFKGKMVQTLESSGLKPIRVWELPEDKFKSFMEMEQRRLAANERYLERLYSDHTPPDPASSPRTDVYATITVGGRVVATIDNQGVVGSSDAVYESLLGRLPDSLNGTNGPDLAQARAEALAGMMGGRIEKSSTAITQSQFNALPPLQEFQPKIDHEAMKKDPMFKQLQTMHERYRSTEQMRAEYLASQLTDVDIVV